MKRTISVLISLFLLTGITTISAHTQAYSWESVIRNEFKDDNLSQNELLIIEKNIDIYKNDDMFIKELENSKSNAIKTVKTAIEKDIQISNEFRSRAVNLSGKYEITGVPTLGQIRYNWCGAASLLQLIYGCGFGNSVPTSAKRPANPSYHNVVENMMDSKVI